MPGTLGINQAETFGAPPIVMSVGPKNEFGTETQQVTRDGERKWSIQAAVQYKAENGMRAVAEVIEITVTGEDPSRSVAPGTPAEFQNLRAGISAPEQRERRDGIGTRVVGGKLWWTASSVRPLGARQPQPQPKADAA